MKDNPNIMSLRNIILGTVFFVFFGALLFAQTPGLSYQAIILDDSAVQAPGYNMDNIPLANSDVDLRFTITDADGTLYVEEFNGITTDEHGMVSLIIGVDMGTAITNSFSDIIWDGNPKNLQVDIDIPGDNLDYVELDNQPIIYIPSQDNRISSGSGAPSGIGTPADIYVDESTGDVYTYNGDTWVLQGGGVSNDPDNLLSLGSDVLPYLQADTIAETSSGTGAPNGNGNSGDIYVDESTGDIYIYDGTSWTDAIADSAYDIWIAQGNTGTEAEFIASLQGASGTDGTNGQDGTDGASAYELALVADPTIGTEAEWLASLQGTDGSNGQDGTDGASAYELALAADPTIGTEAEWLASLQGADGTNGVDGTNGQDGIDGDSAYEIALAADPTIGTEAEWLASLQGADGTNGVDGTNGQDGADGASAYELALAADPTIGTEAEWLASLQGADGTNGVDGTNGQDGTDGDSAYEIALAADPTIGTEAEWLASLQGADGTNGADGANGQDGQSAYDIWIAEGNFGTETDFFNALTGPAGQDGDDGTSVNILGSFDDPADLPAGGNNGDGYLINGDLYVWDGTQYVNAGNIQGPEGPQGQNGQNGQSAYEIALAADPTIGTEAEWLASLQGADGTNGVDGANGQDGTDGASAYELALAADPTIGTEAEWLASLQGADGTNGADGDSAYELALAADPTIGTEAEWLASLQGADGTNGVDGTNGQDGTDGASAYELALAADPTIGTEAEWLASLQGADGTNGVDGANGQDGTDGASAYELALAADPTIGTEAEWLASLQGADGTNGADGDSAYEIALAADPTIGTEAEWLASLQGADGTNGVDGTNGQDGTDGASAYELALAADPTIGTEAEWLASLQGADGAIGAQGPQGDAGPAGAPGNDGAAGNGIASTTDNGDGTFTLNFDDGTTFTTSDLTGPTGATGATGAQGPQGDAGPAGADGSGISGVGDPTSGGVSGSAGDIYVDESTGDIYTYDGTSWVAQDGSADGDTDPANEIELPVGGNSGDVLQTDGAGGYSWTAPASGADNLGDHTATQNIQANGNWLSNDGDNEGVFVATNGDVGVGTNSPSERLDLRAPSGTDAGLRIGAGSEGRDAILYLSTSNIGNISTNKTAIIADGQTTFSRADLHFALNNTANNSTNVSLADSRMVIKRTGRVGIGTTDPSRLLDVDGDTRLRAALYDGNNQAGSAGQVLSSTGTATDWIDASSLGTDDQDASEVNLNPAIDIDGDGSTETTVQDAFTDLTTATVSTKMVFSAEYAGAALQADGSDNTINITSGNSGSSVFMNYYQASNATTSGGNSDFDIVLRFTLPDDFDSWATTAIVIDYEGTANATFEADVFEEGTASALQNNSAVSGSGLGAFSESTLASAAALSALVAEDTGIIFIKLTVTNAATANSSIIRIGDITLNYNRTKL